MYSCGNQAWEGHFFAVAAPRTREKESRQGKNAEAGGSLSTTKASIYAGETPSQF